MSRLVPLALGLLLPLAAVAGKTVKVKDRPLEVGDSGTSVEVLTMEVDIVMQMGSGARMDGELQAERTVARRFEVVSAEAGEPLVLQVTYLTAEERKTLFGRTSTEPFPVAGGTFVVRLDGEAPEVSAPGGGSVSDELREYVADDIGVLVDDGLTIRDKDKHALTVGASAEDLARPVASRVLFEDAALEARVVGSRKDQGVKVAVLDLSMDASISNGPMEIDFDGDGELLLDRKRGHVHTVTLGGPISLTGSDVVDSGMAVGFEGTGTMRWTRATVLD